VKFTPPGGRIRVSSRNDDDAIEIAVADTGVGIDSRDIRRIFHAFTQGETSMGTRHGGLGLGLSISKSLVHAQGGVIRAESPGRGRGSTFIVSLPVVEPPEAVVAPARATSRAPERRAPVRLLLVEDDPDTLEAMALLLREADYHVTTASTFQSALRTAQHASFDVLVSDINLPDGSGLQLMEQIRTSGLSAIALSGFGSNDDVERAKRAGFAAHLTKPVTFSELLSAIEGVLQDDTSS
jgi:CheY-like chemotaxis protein